MVPFAVLSVYAAMRIARGDGRWLLVLAPAFLIGFQMHELEAFLVPMLALVLVWHWRVWLKPRIVVGATALALVVMLPFIAQQVTHHYEDIRAMLQYLLNAATGSPVPSTTGQGSPSAVERVTTALGWLPRALPGPDLINLVLLAVGALGLGWLIVRVARQRSPDAAVLLLYCATPLLYAFWPSPIFSHYALVIYPIPLMLCGLGVAAIVRGAQRWSTRFRRPALPAIAAAAAAVALTLVFAVGFMNSIGATAAEQPVARRWTNVMAVTRQVITDAAGQPFALRIKADFYPPISWVAMWQYPFDHLGTPPDPMRVDLPTYVIFDPADYAGGAAYGGEVVDGVRWARFPTATYGEQLVGDDWQFGGQATGDVDTSTAPVVVHVSADSVRNYAEATQSISVTAGARYLVRYDYRSDIGVVATSVYLQIFDASGTLLKTLPNGGGDRHGPAGAWTTASFMDAAPDGAATAKLILRTRGPGSAWFTNVEVRPVVADEAPW
jgi:hypothetical protein